MARQQAAAKTGAHALATEAGDCASPGVSTQKAGRSRDPAQTKRQAVRSAESEAGPGGREDISAGSETLGVKRDLEAVPSCAAHADSLCTVYSPSLDSNGEQATQSSDHSLSSQRGSPESREADRQIGREGPHACEAGAVSRGNEVLHDEDECRAPQLRRTASASSGSSGCVLFSDEATDEGEEEDVLAAFVKRMGGTHVIRRILIANNGTAAVRCIRSMRHWAYEALGNSKALEFVVMATAADIDANAEFIAEADFYVEVPPGPNSNNYANLHLIVQTAETYECDAVWPGWGHASENHRLPAILRTLKRKTIWIGPSPQAMLALGDKIGSAVIAQSVNVPCVPWSGMDVTVDLSQVDPTKGLSQQTLAAACVQSAKDVLDCCAKIGYPVMIKASEGGGGKGIRRVTNADEVADAYRQVVNEVKGSPVFVMRMVSDCRHLEVQLLADKSGRCVSLGSRDCSIQRRCQKIIEEGPVVAAPPEVVSQMEDAACRMAMAVNGEIRLDFQKNKDLAVDFRRDVGTVVVGLDRSFNYYKLQYAQLCINCNDAFFLGTNRDALGNFTPSQVWAGAGTMVQAVEAATGKKAEVAGKPSNILREYLLTHVLGSTPLNRVCLVGDRLDTDICFAQRLGVRSVLALTGVTDAALLLRHIQMRQQAMHACKGPQSRSETDPTVHRRRTGTNGVSNARPNRGREAEAADVVQGEDGSTKRKRLHADAATEDAGHSLDVEWVVPDFVIETAAHLVE